jgi:hypothetical protein
MRNDEAFFIYKERIAKEDSNAVKRQMKDDNEKLEIVGTLA